MESIADHFQPIFNLTSQEIFQLDSDDDLPNHVESLAKPSSSNSFSVAPGLSAETIIVGRHNEDVANKLKRDSSRFEQEPEIGFCTSYDDPGSYSPPRGPGTSMTNASDYHSLRSAATRDTLSNTPATPEEMAESLYWLSLFSRSSPNVPAKNRTNVNFRLEREFINAFEMLQRFRWLDNLPFIERFTDPSKDFDHLLLYCTCIL